VFLGLLLAGAAWAEAPPAAPTVEQVQQAVKQVRADPLLGHTENHKALRFKPREGKGWDWDFGDKLDWLVALMAWGARALRVLLWVLGAALVVFVLLRLRRWMRVRGAIVRGADTPLPSHVQSLDIRPESLPDVIGAAAAALWQGGQQRAALSLLYRGALSRLVHVYALPIRAASTEGECLGLAQDRLDAPRAAFFARLVGVWLPAVYGMRMPEAEQALDLCRAFDLHLTPGGAA